MKNIMKFAKIVILIGCLVFLGLNAAAQGLEKMSPDISRGFFECTLDNQIVTVTALGSEYHFDARDTLDTLSDLKYQAQKSADQCKQSVAFWGNMLVERGKKYLPLWEEKYRELIFIQEKVKYSY